MDYNNSLKIIYQYNYENASDCVEKHGKDSSEIDKIANIIRKFMKLASAILKGKCIPLLGAGVSNLAEHPDGKVITKVNEMCEALIKHVLPTLCKEQKELVYRIFDYSDKNLESNCREAIKDIFPALSEEQKKIINKKCHFNELYEADDMFLKHVNGQLGKLTEALLMAGVSMDTIVITIDVPKYVNLYPTPAHFYIAFLAKENLIDEVITTNYDCCLENAMRYASCQEHANDIVHSIYDLSTYSIYSSQRYLYDGMKTVLKVYKINGCADAYCRREQSADTILLTERQLQHIDNRAWARDLLRNIIRSKSLILSGFGSDEPQIRFTVLRILEEFSKEADVEDKHKIWIQYYDKLSFTHYQLLYACWEYTWRKSKERNCFDRYYKELTIGMEDFNAIMWLLDKKQDDKDKDKLSADLFWSVVFYFVILALIERYSREGYSFWYWLKELDDQSVPYLRRRDFLAILDPLNIGKKINDEVVDEYNLNDDIRRYFYKKNDETNQSKEENNKDIYCHRPLAVIDQLFGFNKTYSHINGIPFLCALRVLMGQPIDNHNSKNRVFEVFYPPLLTHKRIFLSFLFLITEIMAFCRYMYKFDRMLKYGFCFLLYGNYNDNFLILKITDGSSYEYFLLTNRCYLQKDKILLGNILMQTEIYEKKYSKHILMILYIPTKEVILDSEELIYSWIGDKKIRIYKLINKSVSCFIAVLSKICKDCAIKNKNHSNNAYYNIKNLFIKLILSQDKISKERNHYVRLRRIL